MHPCVCWTKTETYELNMKDSTLADRRDKVHMGLLAGNNCAYLKFKSRLFEINLKTP